MRVPRTGRIGRGAAGLALVAAGTLVLPTGTAVAADAGGGTAGTGPMLNYLVNTKANHGQVMLAERAIGRLGGTVVQSYEQIGVIIARSDSTGFAAGLRASHVVDSVGASRTKAVTAGIGDDTVELATPPAGLLAAGTDEPMQADQWSLSTIGVPEAHRTSLGSRRVVVGVLDSGIDATHEDLAANVDATQSVSCIDSGKPNTDFQAWQPTSSDHGTHVAGTIAAARNGKGVLGIAPDVRLAAVKVVDDGGFIYPEYAVCGFVWAGEHHFQVTNNSYYVDPWLFNCASDPDQAAILTAVRRATAFAERNGVLSVAAAGNENIDLAHKTSDDSSPDDTVPVPRPVDTGCLSLPTELPGVVNVASVGVNGNKSYFSSYGLGKITVAAPGGDARYQIPNTPSRNGRILSTVRGNKYGYMQGTSMASPHAAGVAALLASSHPWAGPDQLRQMLTGQATEHACPTAYDPSGDGAWAAVCEGGTGQNGFYGAGIVNAATAVQWWRW
ncbi:S8 family serine peptidase [Kitasatospora sp. CMC57]|uniref:S8 family serine peptidase n=1 Tax=Kitasatospora sp. CMC57 TaxID=3231513 RepID=A0AB33JVF5_9ACTN